MTNSFGIAEWFGFPFARLSAAKRQALARAALKQTAAPPCPFQQGAPPCSKGGGVCSIQSGDAPPVITCPRRFDAHDLIPRWLARIVGFPDIYLASEVPFMRSPITGRAAGRIDLVVARDGDASAWFGARGASGLFLGRRNGSGFRVTAGKHRQSSAEAYGATATGLAIIKCETSHAAASSESANLAAMEHKAGRRGGHAVLRGDWWTECIAVAGPERRRYRLAYPTDHRRLPTGGTPLGSPVA